MLKKFHHLGFACNSIDRELEIFEKLGYERECDFFEDPQQGVRGIFLVGTGPRVELLENLPGKSTLTPWIEKNIQIYHQAFLVNDISNCLNVLRTQGNIIVVRPVVSVAFGGKKIAFVMMKNRMLIELIEQ